MGRPLRIAWRDEDDAAALRRRYLAEPDGPVRMRLHALWLLRTGRSLAETAHSVGVHYRTLQDWLAWYRHGGVAAMQAHLKAGRGRVARLTPEQQDRLLARAAEGTFYTAQDAVAWVAECYGVRYRVKGMHSLLRRLRRRAKVSRPVT
jgi:transposase